MDTGPANVVIPPGAPTWRASPIWPRRWPGSTGTTTSPSPLCGARPPWAATPAEQELENRLGALCRAFGYDEIITYSFISPACYDKIRWPRDYSARKSFQILNPLGEDTSIMRTTTLPSMLEILTRNYNYRNKSARLYELAWPYFQAGRTAWPTSPRCSPWAPTAGAWTSTP